PTTANRSTTSRPRRNTPPTATITRACRSATIPRTATNADPLRRGPQGSRYFNAIRGRRLFLGHSGLAQAGEINGFEQGADLRHSEILRVLQAGDARVA